MVPWAYNMLWPICVQGIIIPNGIVDMMNIEDARMSCYGSSALKEGMSTDILTDQGDRTKL